MLRNFLIKMFRYNLCYAGCAGSFLSFFIEKSTVSDCEKYAKMRYVDKNTHILTKNDMNMEDIRGERGCRKTEPG